MLGSAGHRLALLSNGALKFSRVTLGDAGSYQCLAQSEAGVAVGRTLLVLQGNVGYTFRAWRTSEALCAKETNLGPPRPG